MGNKLTNAINKKAVPVKIVSDVATPRAKGGIDEWEARNAVDTLRRAEEIRKNKPLMRAAEKEARNQMKQLETVCKPSSGRRK